MEPDGDVSEATEVGGELDLMGGNPKMAGERPGQNDLASFQLVTAFGQVL